VYTPENVYHISLYNVHYVMYSILTESYDQGLLNKPRYIFLPSLVLEVVLKQSKCSKHLTGFLRHCRLCEPKFPHVVEVLGDYMYNHRVPVICMHTHVPRLLHYHLNVMNVRV
jgi:hypothetical protein